MHLGFHVILYQEGADPVACSNGNVGNKVFSRAEAEAFCAMQRVHYPEPRHRYVIEDITPANWQDRETMRFAMELYKPTPWHNEPWYEAKHNEHFCHVSAKDIGKVAFTENAAKGEADRQLVMKPGRYLTRFFSDVLTNEQIEMWCAKLSVSLQEDALKVTQDGDEIEDVYVGGPSSCMAHSVDHFNGHCHPSRVYAGPDLAVAYIGPRDDATGRAVVWPAKKLYGRVYGDVSRMTLLLEQAGYEEGGFVGAKLQVIRDECGNGFIMPYLDCTSARLVNGEIVIGADTGSYLECGNQCGTTGDPDAEPEDSTYCERCEEYFPEEDTQYLPHDDVTWCDRCVRNHTTVCDQTSDRYADDSNTFIDVSRRVKPYYGDAYTVTYTIHEDALDAFGGVYVVSLDEYWHEDDVFMCDERNEYFLNAEAYQWDDETICHEAAVERMQEADEDEAHDSHVRLYNMANRWTLHSRGHQRYPQYLGCTDLALAA